METQKKWMTVTGWILTLLPLLAFGPSAAFKFMDGPEFMKGWTASGYNDFNRVAIAVTETAVVILYLIPKTSILGGLLTIAYLGGAVSTHVRSHDGFWFGAVIVGVLVWGGLFLREPRLRALLPLKS
jgi:hypothetical protein